MTGRVVVLAGPSLPSTDRPEGAELEWAPPACAGDMLRLVDRPPWAVCLIDGYFDDRPAPWHKEILALMARGVPVFGASSMGALRAAELNRQGMIGVGAVFRAYRDGLLTGDDEVACVHAPGELGWAALTVPMVEVRATLVAARRRGLIDGATARAARALAHDVHFADRDWPALERAWTAGGPMTRVVFDRVRASYLPLKRLDALACLALARGRGGSPYASPPPPRTCYLDALAAEVAAAASSAAKPSVNASPTDAAKG